MTEQIRILEATSRVYMMLSKSLKSHGISSWRSYARQGMECCKMVIELEREWIEDITKEFLIAA